MTERAVLTDAGSRVLAAAAELFYRKGINAVGVASIAETAAVTKKTLYDCFGSKDALVVAYLRHRHLDWWEYLQAQLAEAAPPRVLVVFDTYLEHPGVDLSRGCAFLNAAAELPPGHEGRAVIEDHKNQVQQLLARLSIEDHPDIAEPAELAEHLFLLLEGATVHSGLNGSPGALWRAGAIAASLLAGPSRPRHVLR
ncbi:TetR/AcrR family transcriptional regulator [Sciscionella marina]|uniref:TetR/AcrR family transcriptional regulator n=1 Tax=Sciscionella marina TaxID=508770 RepID=UPI000475A8BB|nr:TetR/AcrR family transcriptional regulator [Sciscionella marina]